MPSGSLIGSLGRAPKIACETSAASTARFASRNSVASAAFSNSVKSSNAASPHSAQSKSPTADSKQLGRHATRTVKPRHNSEVAAARTALRPSESSNAVGDSRTGCYSKLAQIEVQCEGRSTVDSTAKERLSNCSTAAKNSAKMAPAARCAGTASGTTNASRRSSILSHLRRSPNITATPSTPPEGTVPVSSKVKLEAKKSPELDGNKPRLKIQTISRSKAHDSCKGIGLLCIKSEAPQAVATTTDKFVCRPRSGQSTTSRSVLHNSVTACISRLTYGDPQSVVAVKPSSERLSCSAYFRRTKSRQQPLPNAVRLVRRRSSTELSGLTPSSKARTHWITPCSAAPFILSKPSAGADRRLSVGVAHGRLPARAQCRKATGIEADQKPRQTNQVSASNGRETEAKVGGSDESLAESDSVCSHVPISPVPGRSIRHGDGYRDAAVATTIRLKLPSGRQRDLGISDAMASRKASNVVHADTASFTDQTSLRSRAADASVVVFSAPGGGVRRKWWAPPVLRLAGSGIPIVRDVNADAVPSFTTLSASPKKYAAEEILIMPSAQAPGATKCLSESFNVPDLSTSGKVTHELYSGCLSSASCGESSLTGTIEVPDINTGSTSDSIPSSAVHKDKSGGDVPRFSNAYVEIVASGESLPRRTRPISPNFLANNGGFACLISGSSDGLVSSEKQNRDNHMISSVLSSDREPHCLDASSSKFQSALHSRELVKPFIAETATEQVTSLREKSRKDIQSGETIAVFCANACSLLNHYAPTGDNPAVQDKATVNAVKMANGEQTADLSNAKSVIAAADLGVCDFSTLFPCRVTVPTCQDKKTPNVSLGDDIMQVTTAMAQVINSFCHPFFNSGETKWQVFHNNADTPVSVDIAQNLGKQRAATRTICVSDSAQVFYEQANRASTNQKGQTTAEEQKVAKLSESTPDKPPAAFAKSAARGSVIVSASTVNATDARSVTTLITTETLRSSQVKNNALFIRDATRRSMCSVEAAQRSSFERANAVPRLTKKYRTWSPPAELHLAGCSTPLLYRNTITCASA